jgi:hypothetical protein
MEEDHGAEQSAEEIVLMDGWLLGRLLFPIAVQEMVRVPPANDRLKS